MTTTVAVATSSADLLRRAKGVLEEYGWIQGDIGHCERGFCAYGALDHASRATDTPFTDFWPARKAVTSAVLDLSAGGSFGIANYNDDAGRTVEDIYAMFDKAIEIVEAKKV